MTPLTSTHKILISLLKKSISRMTIKFNLGLSCLLLMIDLSSVTGRSL